MNTVLQTLETKTVEKKFWGQLFRVYILPHRDVLIALILTAILVAVCEASLTLITRSVVDSIVKHKEQASLLKIGMVYFGLLLTLGISVWAFILMAGRLSTRIMYHLRQDGFSHLQDLSFSFYDKHSIGWLMARLTSDCNKVADIIAWGTLEVFWAAPFLLGISGVLLFLNWKLGLLVLTVIPLVIAVSIYFQRIIVKSSRKVRKVNSQLTASFNEGITGVETSKVLVREQANLEEFQKQSQNMYANSFKNANQTAAYFPFILGINSIATGLALWLGGDYALSGLLTLGTLITFLAYTSAFHEPVLELARIMAELQTANAGAERIFGLLKTKPEIEDSDLVSRHIKEQKRQVNGVPHDGGESDIKTIEFDNVSFEYLPGQSIIKDINLKVEAGSSVALVGPTGGGKTTLVNLMCRFYEPTRGQILLNGSDYKNRGLLWYQSNLGIVLQTPFLFSGSIEENIRYGKLDASYDDVMAAAKAVNAHDFISRLEEGYQTQVGQEGKHLSTGQKQLISFARAILADPKIFVMDEATSAVDTQTESLIQKGLSKILEGRTSFIIAHRLSTIRSADVILVVENGSITEKGNHEELIKLRGAYHRLYRKQFVKEKQALHFRSMN